MEFIHFFIIVCHVVITYSSKSLGFFFALFFFIGTFSAHFSFYVVTLVKRKITNLAI